MENLNVTPKNNKVSILVCFILLAVHSPAFSQNKIGSLIASVNYNFALPIMCVLALAVFLLTAFIRQKNH